MRSESPRSQCVEHNKFHERGAVTFHYIRLPLALLSSEMRYNVSFPYASLLSQNLFRLFSVGVRKILMLQPMEELLGGVAHSSGDCRL